MSDRVRVVVKCAVLGVVSLGMALVPEVGVWGLLVGLACWTIGGWVWYTTR